MRGIDKMVQGVVGLVGEEIMVVEGRVVLREEEYVGSEVEGDNT
jgi:hypothetical protein